MYIKEIDANVFVMPQEIPLCKALRAFGLEDANVQIVNDLEEYYFIISKKIHTRKYEFYEIVGVYCDNLHDKVSIQDIANANAKWIKRYFHELD